CEFYSFVGGPGQVSNLISKGDVENQVSALKVSCPRLPILPSTVPTNFLGYLKQVIWEWSNKQFDQCPFFIMYWFNFRSTSMYLSFNFNDVARRCTVEGLLY